MMKKITLLCFLLVASIGYSQVVLEDFEGTAPTIGFSNGAGTATIVADPAAGGTNGNVLEIITAAAAAPWQQGELTVQADLIDLSGTNKTVEVDVYSMTAFDMLARVEPGVGNGGISATDASHDGTGWETLSFDFNIGKDNQAAANGTYEKIFFFNLWSSSANGGAGGWAYANNESVVFTSHVDNIKALSSPRAETCNDGIMNNGETEIDCGGPNCDACDPLPTSLSPDPTNGTGVNDADVLSVFNDAGDFSNTYATDFSFGDEFRTIIDLDEGTGVDNVIKLSLNAGGWGAGNNSEVELIAAGFTHFNFSYYVPNLTPGTEGHLLQATLVSRTPGAGQDPDAVFNISPTATGPGTATMEFDKWVNMSIPLSDFSNFNTHLLLFKFATPSTAFSPLAFVDNIFFSKSTVTLSTDNNELLGFSIFPNPASNRLNISAKETIQNADIFNVIGKKVKSINVNSTRASFDISDLSSGIYLIKYNVGNKVGTSKFIKE